jgi:transcriptional regulator with XRE-family HTH domain
MIERGQHKLLNLEAEAIRLADRVRALRRVAGLTLQGLAERSTLSASTLSKIENGQLSPTYETILRLANGFGVDVSTLFSGEESTPVVTARRTVTRRDQGVVHDSPQYRYEMLATEVSHKAFIPLVTTIKARDIAEFGELPRHDGEEFIYVLSGSIALHTSHYDVVLLQAGDSCYLDSTMGHAIVSAGETDAEVLWITAGHRDVPSGQSS